MFAEISAINATLPPVLDPIFGSVRSLIGWLNIVLGGIFGLYLIIVYINWKKSRELVRLLKDVKSEIKLLNNNITLMMRKKK